MEKEKISSKGAIKLTNTLSGKKEIFNPIKEGEVKIYLCGPTVYDEPHIGHVRSAYVFDVIRKYFHFRGYKVRFVRNVTDIDDKIIQKARELGRGDLISATSEISQRYYDIYTFWMRKMGIDSPDIEPRATEHISEMQELIRKLLKKEYAYIADGNVYYNIRKFKGYGKLSKQSLEQMLAGARVEPDEEKEYPLDFALWKKTKPDEPFWESPWGKGRPGWHIECSTMSMLYLGSNFDIHCGGQDLIFPHHENEIAQSEAVSGQVFANYWLHNGMLTIAGKKMAKSLGNYVTVKEVLEKFHPDVLKLFFLSVHYRNPVDFTWEQLEEVSQAKERFDSFFSRVDNLRRPQSHSAPDSSSIFQIYRNQISDFSLRFYQAMDDDFNTALALGVLYELLNLGNRIYQETNILFYQKMILLSEVKDSLLDFGRVFSLFKKDSDSVLDYDILIQAVIKIRNRLREEGRYELADKIREDLGGIGIILEDGKSATTWRKAGK